jgi:ATP-dependent DNA ligase
VDEAPIGHGWLHEIKYDGYRMHVRIHGGKVALLTRTGLDLVAPLPARDRGRRQSITSLLL